MVLVGADFGAAFFVVFFAAFFFAAFFIVPVLFVVGLAVLVDFDIVSAANTTPTDKANAIAVNRAIIFFMDIHLLSLARYVFFIML
jgi:hypothetical protein